MKKKSFILINPEADHGKVRRRWPLVKERLFKKIGSCPFEFAKSTIDCGNLALRIAREGYDQIIFVGNDASINYSINSLMSSKLKKIPIFAQVLTCRYDQDFFFSLNPHLKGQKNEELLEASLDIIKSGRAKTIDLGIADFAPKNTKSKKVQREYFLNLASFGIADKIIDQTADSPLNFHSGLAYLSSCIKSLKKYNAPVVSVKNGKTHLVKDHKVFNCFISNGRYGGTMDISPEAKLTDGKLHALAISDGPMLDLMIDLPLLWLQGSEGLDDVHTLSSSEFSASAGQNHKQVSVSLDGVVKGTLPAKFSVANKSIKFLSA